LISSWLEPELLLTANSAASNAGYWKRCADNTMHVIGQFPNSAKQNADRLADMPFELPTHAIQEVFRTRSWRQSVQIVGSEDEDGAVKREEWK
jgi:hypothetical protein